MGLITKAVYTVVVAGAAFGLGYIARGDSEYRIIRSGDTVTLSSHTLEKQHELRMVNGDFYLGNANHNFNGFRELAILEGKKEIADLFGIPAKEPATMPAPVTKKDELQDRVDEFSNKVRKEWSSLREQYLTKKPTAQATMAPECM